MISRRKNINKLQMYSYYAEILADDADHTHPENEHIKLTDYETIQKVIDSGHINLRVVDHDASFDTFYANRCAPVPIKHKIKPYRCRVVMKKNSITYEEMKCSSDVIIAEQ